MIRLGRATLIAIVAWVGCTGLAQAAPPTVVPSPGYDARLQEQRAASHAAITHPANRPVVHRHPQRKNSR